MKTREVVNMQEVGSKCEMHINATGDRYGTESMELAEVLLELARIILLRPRTDRDEDRVPASLVTHDGHIFVATPLKAYLFQKPELIETRLQRVESVLLSALPTWANSDLEKFENAVAALVDFGTYYDALGKQDHFEQLILKVLDLCRRHLSPTHALTVETLNDLGTTYQRHGKAKESGEVLEEALALCESDPATMAFSGPRVLSSSAENAIAFQKLDSALRHLELAMEILERAAVVDKGEVLSVLYRQARVFHLMENRREFDRVASQAQQVADEVWQAEPEFVIQTMSALAALYSLMGAEPEAEKIMHKLTQDIAIFGFSEERRTTFEGLMRLVLRMVRGAKSDQTVGDRDH